MSCEASDLHSIKYYHSYFCVDTGADVMSDTSEQVLAVRTGGAGCSAKLFKALRVLL